MKRDSFTVVNRFEVSATLQDQSNPAFCTEGQRIQYSEHSDGADTKNMGNKTSDPRYDSEKGEDDPYDPDDDPDVTEKTDCGYGDDVWCDDGYHGGGGANGIGRKGYLPPNRFKTYDGQERILWLDAPGYNPLVKSDLAPDGASVKFKFEAKVSGSTGECQCSWEVLIEIDKDGKILNNKVQNVNCSP